MPMWVRAVRGAIVVPEDTPEGVLGATERLLRTLLDRNAIAPEDLISILFTATDDLRAAFPAEAARRMGLGRVPLLCARELPVRGSMPSVVRVLVHFHTDRTPEALEPVYLDGAESLRDDLDP
ncbi:MAG: chorismate mutase AroH [Actinomycetota bacterium]|jgi:chorismate mutase|nr:MAG: chorismate mutase AroH [Actinomycetota bacterium]